VNSATQRCNANSFRALSKMSKLCFNRLHSISFRSFSSHTIDNDVGNSYDAFSLCSKVRNVKQQLENYTSVVNVGIFECVLQRGVLFLLRSLRKVVKMLPLASPYVSVCNKWRNDESIFIKYVVTFAKILSCVGMTLDAGLDR
jgi:hypothetical protein